jgi:hypothetical protein
MKKQRIYTKQNKFWTSFISRSNNQNNLLKNRKPSVNNFLNIGTGKSGLVYRIKILKKMTSIELFINKYTKEQNDLIFEHLETEKDKIELNYGTSLFWLKIPEKKYSKIVHCIHGIGIDEENDWTKIQDEMISITIRFIDIFSPLLNNV